MYSMSRTRCGLTGGCFLVANWPMHGLKASASIDPAPHGGSDGASPPFQDHVLSLTPICHASSCCLLATRAAVSETIAADLPRALLVD
jgi:hypothetical protein